MSVFIVTIKRSQDHLQKKHNESDGRWHNRRSWEEKFPEEKAFFCSFVGEDLIMSDGKEKEESEESEGEDLELFDGSKKNGKYHGRGTLL